MTYTFADVVSMIDSRRAFQERTVREMEAVRRRYNADLVVPTPDVADQPVLPTLAPLYIANAIDKTAQRAAGVSPVLSVAADNPFGRQSTKLARSRELSLLGTWHQSDRALLMRRYFRHLTGYGTSVVMPSPTTDGVRFKIRNPLTSYPEPHDPTETKQPETWAGVWLMAAHDVVSRWPWLHSDQGGPVNPTITYTSQLWEVFEWHDPEQQMWGLLGPQWSLEVLTAYRVSSPAQLATEIETVPNLLGELFVVAPEAVTLDRMGSRIAQLIGVADMADRMTKLRVLAEEKAVFPDTYIVSSEGATAAVLGGWKDGRTGEVNVIEDARDIGQIRANPDPSGQVVIDNLERAISMSAGTVPAQFGETYGALRTGRGVDSMLAASVDPFIQELHEITEVYWGRAFEMASKMWRRYYGSKTYSLFTGQRGDAGKVECQPSKWEKGDTVSLSYPIPGADVTTLTIALGQLLGAGMISKKDFAEQHPWITDWQTTRAELYTEALEEATLAALLQKMAAGEAPPTYGAMLHDALGTDWDIFEAIKKVDEKLREQQAQEPPEPMEGQMADPSTMPGLMGQPMPGGGMPMPPAQPPPAIEGPNTAQANLKALNLALSSGANRGAPAPAVPA